MATKIEWAEETWNPITGCTPISEGCQNCYAQRMSKRLAGRCGYDKHEPFKVVKHDEVFIKPLKWRNPKRVFVCSMGDLFHEDVHDDWILAAFIAMSLTYEHTGQMKEVEPGHSVAICAPKHTFMILTKRPERMKQLIDRLYSDEPDEDWERKIRHFAFYFSSLRGDILPSNAIFTTFAWLRDGMPGLWLGATCENQARADERIPILLQIPAAVRFVSVEPMLGPVDLTRIDIGGNVWINSLTGDCKSYHPYGGMWKTSESKNKLDWVICGGETGPGARPMHPDWARSLRDQCQAVGVRFFFKSWGDYCFVEQMSRDAYAMVDKANNLAGHGDYEKPWKVGKKRAGRLLDGREWNEYPGAGI